MTDITEYYFFIEDMDVYFEDSEIGKKRLEGFKKFYGRDKEFFGKRVLDLCCGGGLISNFLAREGHEVVGVDYLQEMLDRAEKNKPEKDNPKYIRADLKEYEISEDFDTVLIWGNSIAHFSPQTLAGIFKRIRDRTKYLILEYADFVSFGFTGNLKEFMVGKGTSGELVLDVYGGYDGIDSRMIKYAFIPSKRKVLEFDVNLHNPGTISGILEALDFSLIKRKPTERFFGSGAPSYVDIWTTLK